MPKKGSRAYWKGHLRLSLVSLPVEIYSAVESQAAVTFNEIHKPSGRRVGRQRFVDGIGAVKNEDVVKGVEVEPDHYAIVDQAEIDALKIESSRTIDLVQFCDAKEIDYRYMERPYFIVPADRLAGEGYVVIRDALRKMNKVGLAQVTISGREWLVAISPIETAQNGGGLVMEMLRYADELRDPLEYFDEVPPEKPQKDMVDLATQLISQKSSAFKAEKFTNHYQAALHELVQAKRKGKKLVAAPDVPRSLGGNVVDLMDALRKSVEGKDKKAKAKPAAKSGKKSA